MECLSVLGTLAFFLALALAPAHRTLNKARHQAQTIRHWDERQAAWAEAVASGALQDAGTNATSAK